MLHFGLNELISTLRLMAILKCKTYNLFLAANLVVSLNML